MAHKTDVAESTEKLSSAFAGRLAVGANDGCKALGISKTKWFELRRQILHFLVRSVLAPPFAIA